MGRFENAIFHWLGEWLDKKLCKGELDTFLNEWADGDRDRAFNLVRKIYDKNKKKIFDETNEKHHHTGAMVHVIRLLNGENARMKDIFLSEPIVCPAGKRVVESIVEDVLKRNCDYREKETPVPSELIEKINENLGEMRNARRKIRF